MVDKIKIIWGINKSYCRLCKHPHTLRNKWAGFILKLKFQNERP